MNMEHKRGSKWPDPTAWIDPLAMVIIMLIVVSALIFLVGYVLPSSLLRTLGTIVLGAGVAALVGGFTGRWAIHQQSAKEANVWRKEHIYGPLYAELKTLHAALLDAKAGKAPAPLWIDNGVDVPRTIIFYQPSSLTFHVWPELRRGYHDTDFKAASKEHLDRVDESVTTYNTAIEAARQAAISMLAGYINVAIAAVPQHEEYQQRQQQAKQQTHRISLGHAQSMPHDWFDYLEFVGEFIAMPRGETPGSQLAEVWLSHWPDPVSISPVPGWLLAEQPDKAAEYVSHNYAAAIQNLPPNAPPPPDWIAGIFEMAWPDLQQDPQFCRAQDAREIVCKHVEVAKDILDRGLRAIQKQFEGGEPLV